MRHAPKSGKTRKGRAYEIVETLSNKKLKVRTFGVGLTLAATDCPEKLPGNYKVATKYPKKKKSRLPEISPSTLK